MPRQLLALNLFVPCTFTNNRQPGQGSAGTSLRFQLKIYHNIEITSRFPYSPSELFPQAGSLAFGNSCLEISQMTRYLHTVGAFCRRCGEFDNTRCLFATAAHKRRLPLDVCFFMSFSTSCVLAHLLWRFRLQARMKTPQHQICAGSDHTNIS